MNHDSKSKFQKLNEDIEENECCHKTEEVEKQSSRLRDFKVSSNLWIAAGLLAGLIYATSNFFIGSASNHGFYARMLIGLGNMIVAIFYFLINGIINKLYNNSDFWNKSVFYDEVSGKFKPIALIILLFDSSFSVVGGYATVVSFQYALYADLNQGIIGMLFSFTAVFLMFSSFIIFHERPNNFHIIGMFCLIISTIIIGFSGHKGEEKHIIIEGEEVQLISKFVPIAFAIITTLYFCIRSLCIKAYRIKMKFTIPELMSYSFLIHGVIFLIICLYNILNYGIDPKLLINSILGGIFQALGGFCSYYATSHGYSGPASALVNIQAVIQLALIWIFMKQLPTPLELVGFVLGIFGSFVMVIGKQVVNLLFIKSESKGNLE